MFDGSNLWRQGKIDRQNQQETLLEAEDFVELEEIEELKELQELKDSGTKEPFNSPWPLFPSFKDRKIPLEDCKEIRVMEAYLKNSPIPSCLMDLDLKIFWKNESSREQIDPKYILKGTRISEKFTADNDKDLNQILHKYLENKECNYSWQGRLIPCDERNAESFLKATIQPVFFSQNKEIIPLVYLIQWDVITPEYDALLKKTFLSLLEASKLKDNDTGKHVERVNLYSRCLALKLQGSPGYELVDEAFVKDISFLAAMHDIGKIGTPDDILHKKGPLDAREREIMNEHTTNGVYILQSYPKPMAVEIARSHHEKWDGSGYPYGIFEKMIPLSARIVTIADVYDALRSKRSYKNPFSHEWSVKIMTKGRGRHFDPKLFDHFLEVQGEFEKIFSENQD